MSYCEYCNPLPFDNLHKIYHDTKYGFVILDDDELFGRLILEINQAGLSWNTILLKENNFRKLFDNFSVTKIANYEDVRVSELLLDSRIIRNRLKIEAVVYNSKKIMELQQRYGSFAWWLYMQNSNSLDEWVKIFKRTFTFVGPEIVREFLQSIGICGDAHDKSCKIHKIAQDYNTKTLAELVK